MTYGPLPTVLVGAVSSKMRAMYITLTLLHDGFIGAAGVLGFLFTPTAVERSLAPSTGLVNIWAGMLVAASVLGLLGAATRRASVEIVGAVTGGAALFVWAVAILENPPSGPYSYAFVMALGALIITQANRVMRVLTVVQLRDRV